MAKDTPHKFAKIVNSSVLESFAKLGSNVERIRVTAGIALLRHLHRSQKKREDGTTCYEINYALKRLIRGVSTACTIRRAGYFSVLVEMFTLFPEITVQDVMNFVDTELQPIRNSPKKEYTEAYGGHVFVIGALIYSNKLLCASPDVQANIVQKLVSAGRVKMIFAPCVNSFLVDLMKKIDDASFKEVMWPQIKPELTKSWVEHTPNSLYLLLEVRDHFPDVVKKKFLMETLGTTKILNEESIHLCSKLLMDSPLMIMSNHPFYEIVLRKVSSDLLIPYWESLVKEMEKRPSLHREQALIKTLVKLIPLIDKNQIPELLCDGFMEFIIKTFQTRKSKAELAKDASDLFVKMSNILENGETDDNIKISFIKRLLLYPGHLSFDLIAGTKIVTQLCSSMTVKEIDQIGQMLKNIISASELKVKSAEGETCAWNKMERIYALQLFSKLLSLSVAQENVQWKINQLKFLIAEGFVYSSKHQPGDIVNQSIASEVRDNFFKVLDPKLSTVDQLITLLSSLVHHLNGLIFAKKKSLKWCQPLSESSLAAWKEMFAVLNELESIQESGTGLKRSGNKLFIVLFLHMGLQLLQDAALAEEALQELHSCYERTKNEPVKSKKRTKNIVTDVYVENEPFWVEVVVDLFLLLLSRNSNLFRNVVGSIFPHLCPYLTATSVHQLLEVLDPNAKKPLSNVDEEKEQDDESSDDSEAEDGNSSKQSGGNDGLEEDEDEDDDDDDDFEDDDDEPVNDQLKLAVQNALKKSMINSRDSDEESVDMDQMTEDERNRLDAALSEAFKLLKYTQADKKNKKQSKDDETIMHFRIRVLDLIDVYLSKKPDFALVLDIIQPLFGLLEFCIKDSHQKPLENRVRSCLKKLTHVKQFSSVTGVEEDLIAEILKKLLQKGERVAAVYQNMGSPLCLCSTFLTRTSLHLAPKQSVKVSSKSPILDVYKEALVSFFTNRESLLPLDVFKQVLALPWKGAWSLTKDIMKFVFTPDCRPFRRSQAVKLLVTFFSNGRLVQDASQKNCSKLQKMEKKLGEETAEILRNVVNGKQNVHYIVKGKNVEELLRLLHTIWKLHRKRKETVPSGIQWNSMWEAISQYWQSQSLANDAKAAIQKLSSALNMKLPQKSSSEGVSNEQSDCVGNKTKKRRLGSETVEVEGEASHDSSEDNRDKGYESGNNKDRQDNAEEGEGKKKRKRARTQNRKGKAILKKQSKKARLATMAQGLENGISFSEVNLSNLQKLTNENGNEFADQRKRKKSEGNHKPPRIYKKIPKTVRVVEPSESKSVRKFNLKIKRSAEENQFKKKKQKKSE